MVNSEGKNLIISPHPIPKYKPGPLCIPCLCFTRFIKNATVLCRVPIHIALLCHVMLYYIYAVYGEVLCSLIVGGALEAFFVHSRAKYGTRAKQIA